MDIVKNFRLTRLFDFYSRMLTDKQKLIFERYYFDDASLKEIADECNISRQAVRDSLVSAEKSLNELESKINLLSKFDSIEKLLDGSNIDAEYKEKIMQVWEGK